MRSLVHHIAVAAGLSLAVACADMPTQPDAAASAARNAKGGTRGAGTTLIASKTAVGYYERQTEYDWSIEKHVKAIMGADMVPEPSVTTTQIDPRTIKWVDYVLVATRDPSPTVTTVAGVRGEICVLNDGDRATEGLAIRDVVQRNTGGAWQDVAAAPVSVAEKPVLAPHEQYCYPYDIPLPAQPGDYRNTAFVTITNHSGSLGVPSGPAINGGGIKAVFSIPASPTEVTLDAEARIWDPGPMFSPPSYVRGGCAELWPVFFCTQYVDVGSWTISDSRTFEFMVDIGNLYGCGETYEMKNTAQLIESGKGDFGPLSDTHFATSTFSITTPACPPATAAVRDAAYWSQGTGWPPHQFWGPSFRIQDYQFFDSGMTWLEMLRLSPRTRYDRLAQEFIATTLNFMNRAPVPRSVLDVRNEVAAWFASWPADRAAVSDAQLDAWTSALSAYNEGGTP